MNSEAVDRRVLGDAIARLPEAEKLVVTLAYYEELTDAEIAAAVDADEAEVTGLHESAIKLLADAIGFRPEPNADLAIHPVYLPFAERELREHFAAIAGKSSGAVADGYLPYYLTSATRNLTFREAQSLGAALPITDEVRRACQIEKDERFWIVASLMTYYRAADRAARLAALLARGFGPTPPMEGIDDWRSCFTDTTALFFETNLPSPPSYRTWLAANIARQHLVPYVLNAAAGQGTSLEGPTKVDAILLDPSTGCAVLFEAKVLADCSTDVRFDAFRNQIARNIDVMLDPNPTLPHPLSTRDPARTLFALITPRVFHDRPHSRLYGRLMNEYHSTPDALARDLPHRNLSRAKWNSVSERLGWLTWEDCDEVLSGACRWLGNSADAQCKLRDADSLPGPEGQ